MYLSIQLKPALNKDKSFGDYSIGKVRTNSFDLVL